MYTLRPSILADYDLVKELHHRAIGLYLAEGLGWSVADIDRSAERWFRGRSFQIVSSNGRDVGLLSIEDRGERIFLENILILPEYQGHGIGSAVVRDILTRASREGAVVVLLVLKNNPAKKLYDRLGFVVTFEDRTHFHMQWSDPGLKSETT